MGAFASESRPMRGPFQSSSGNQDRRHHAAGAKKGKKGKKGRGRGPRRESGPLFDAMMRAAR